MLNYLRLRLAKKVAIWRVPRQNHWKTHGKTCDFIGMALCVAAMALQNLMVQRLGIWKGYEDRDRMGTFGAEG